MLKRYNTLCQHRNFPRDPAQEHLLHALQKLQEKLQKKKPFWRCLGQKNTLKGLYIHGEVGRGKTMLMDLFFSCVEGVPKHRFHFHDFMKHVHTRLKKIRT